MGMPSKIGNKKVLVNLIDNYILMVKKSKKKEKLEERID
jgi:hypothetical protein